MKSVRPVTDEPSTRSSSMAGRRASAAVSRPEARIGGQRRAERQPEGARLQPADRRLHLGMVAALQPVRQDHDRRAARESGEARHREKGEQRRADARAAVPIVDRLRDARERAVAVARCAAARVMRVRRVPSVKTSARSARLHDRMRELADSRRCAASSSRKCRSGAAACADTCGRRRSRSDRGTSPSARRSRAASGADRACRASARGRCGRSGASGARPEGSARKPRQVSRRRAETAAAASVSVDDASSPPVALFANRQFARSRAAVVLDLRFLVVFAVRSRYGVAPEAGRGTAPRIRRWRSGGGASVASAASRMSLHRARARAAAPPA